MDSISKINPLPKSNPDTGFGVQATQMGGRFVNKDGTFNLRKIGWPLWKRVSIYSRLLTISWPNFLLAVLLFYLFSNVLFTLAYVLVGHRQLQGLLATSEWGKVKEIFFFSTETFTTVGYGRINPVGDGAHIIASLECMCGVVSFALVTGLLYGRFTRPKAYLAFTRQALISPYKGISALMFRMVPYKENHHLTDARVVVTVSLTIMEEEQPVFKFYELKLERSHIDTFNMNWTVVHPIDEESPLLNFTLEDMQRADMEVYVRVTGFDPLFSNTVMQRTSYTYKEVVWGGKFKPMYRESEDGSTTIVELNKLEEYDQVDLLQAAV